VGERNLKAEILIYKIALYFLNFKISILDYYFWLGGPYPYLFEFVFFIPVELQKLEFILHIS
jgi:hypothetical protein